LLGAVADRNGSGWCHRIQINDWYLKTWIDVGGSAQLRYTHFLCSTNPAYLKGLCITDFMKWLGMGQTTWNLLTEEDVLLAAQTLAELGQHFLNALPELLSDLVLTPG
jgi:hypothetical protein